MDQSPRTSGIPRLSRLPVPRSILRAAPSSEDLRSSRIEPGMTPSLGPDTTSTPIKRELNSPLRSQPSLNRLNQSVTKQDYSRKTPQATLNSSRTLRTRKSILSPQSTCGEQSETNKVDYTRIPFVGSQDIVDSTPEESNDVVGTPRKSSLSLSERAAETLQGTPSARRRRSSFFNTDSPMRPTSSGNPSSRPGSSHNSQMRPPSRPGSRAGIVPDFRVSTSTYRTSSSSSGGSTMLKKPSVSTLRLTPGVRASSAVNRMSIPSVPGQKSQRARSPSPIRTTVKPAVQMGSRTLAARPVKARPSISNLFSEHRSSDSISNDAGQAVKVAKRRLVVTSRTVNPETNQLGTPGVHSPSTRNETETSTPRKSSMALRDQIARAKAAKRAMNKPTPGDNASKVSVVPKDDFDVGLADDPFGQQQFREGSKGLLKKRIQTARLDGRLNISALGLKDIPDEVLSMYEFETNDGSWAECVDLTRFAAAGNEIEIIPDHVFPDTAPQTYMDDEDAVGNQFGGLEMLDLHANLLKALPIGLRRLENLTSLNVADNKLGNEAVAMISRIKPLRDLKLSNNGLTGALAVEIAELVNLESLDLQHNAITSLPDELQSLSRLRTLNLNENRVSRMPSKVLQQLPLSEIFLVKNKLTGSFCDAEVTSLPHLQVLDVTGNSLDKLTSTEGLLLPALHQLSINYNRIAVLPDMSTWTSLRTLAAEDNLFESIPSGFTTLSSLRNVDFRGNSIRILDEQIGNMDELDIFRISGNPLRERKFAGMTTEDLKRALRARLAPVEPVPISDFTSTDGTFLSPPTSPFAFTRPKSADWLVGSGGVLDRSNLKSNSLNPVAASQVAANHQIVTLELHHNMLKEIPSSIGFFSATLVTLNISHNMLNSDTFFSEELELPELKELNISCNTIDSLQPLIERLQAPKLIKLDISFNRLSSLPVLKPHFQNLVTLFASNNAIRELSSEAVRGLTTLDCSSNEINSLNPRIGLLGGPGGLQRLDVSGNRFRVPKYTVLEKGTEATLAWLKDRVPANELPPQGSGDDE